MPDEPMVIGEPNSTGTETPSVPDVDGTEQTPAPSVPTPTPSDAEERLSKLEADYQARLSQQENDIRRLKSTYDSKISQESKQWRERERAYQEQIDELKLKVMPEEQRRTYTEQISARRTREIQEELNALARERDDAKNTLMAQNYFIQRGVPASQLVVDQGYEELWKSGQTYLDEELSRLRKAAQPSPPPAVQGAPLKRPPEAPAVATGTVAPAYSPGWPELIKKYGSVEEVFRLVEARQLDPSVIPIKKG